jgi:hypothetical protein
LRRDRLADRLEEKPSKRTIAQSEAGLRALEHKRLASDGTIPLDYPHLTIDTDATTARDAADQALQFLRVR